MLQRCANTNTICTLKIHAQYSDYTIHYSINLYYYVLWCTDPTLGLENVESVTLYCHVLTLRWHSNSFHFHPIARFEDQRWWTWWSQSSSFSSSCSFRSHKLANVVVNSIITFIVLLDELTVQGNRFYVFQI